MSYKGNVTCTSHRAACKWPGAWAMDRRQDSGEDTGLQDEMTESTTLGTGRGMTSDDPAGGGMTLPLHPSIWHNRVMGPASAGKASGVFSFPLKPLCFLKPTPVFAPVSQ